MSNLMLQVALEYARRGWPVFPCFGVVHGRCECGDSECESPGKHPRTEHGFKDATTSERKIREWWSKWPNANVAIATGRGSHLVVWDVDPRHHGDQSLKSVLKGTKLPTTLKVRTGGGGTHIFFAYPDDMEVQSHIDIRPGLDIRADGGYVIAPPSLHVSGRRYQWFRI
jgi:Bifunctional DNA primase/polymerase, N-terminal